MAKILVYNQDTIGWKSIYGKTIYVGFTFNTNAFLEKISDNLL